MKNSINHRPARLSPICLALAAFLGTAWTIVSAQTVAQSGSNAVSEPTTQDKLETVTVTSQRRLERLQDVPIAVKAFSAKQIESTGIKSTQDFINLTPNMSFDNSFTYGNSFVVIRGVTQINNADSPVAVVIDGVPQNNQKQLKMNLFDIERIEVLKGPQGALYGRNAIGGAINIETKQPKNQFEGFGGVDFGNGNMREVSAGVSGAFVDNVALFRLVGQSKSADGLINNTYVNKNVDAIDHDNSVRARLVLRPSQDVRLDFRESVTDFSAGATWDSVVTSGNPNNIVAPKTSLLGKTEGTTQDFSFKADVDSSVGTFTAITGYTDLSEQYRGDLDFSNPVDLPGGFFGFGFQAGQGQNLKVKMLSQELRLVSPADKPLRWIAGGYYLSTQRSLVTKAFIDATGSHAQWDDPAKNIVNIGESNDNKAYAVFGQLDYDLNRDLTLSGALRYDRDERQQTSDATGLGRTADFSAWQPKVTLTKRFGPDALAYGTYSTGFRSGGFNAPGLVDFKAENLNNFELGAKNTLFDKRLILNGALFYSQSKNFQYFYVDAKSAAQIISNLDRVDIKGLDLDLRYLPVKGLEFDGGLGLTDSKIKENQVAPNTVGNYTPKASPLKMTLGVQYEWPIAVGLSGNFRFDVEHRAQKYWHPDNVAVSDALNLIGLRVGLLGAKDKWSVTLYGRNLTDQKYYADYNSKAYSGLPYDIGSLAQPRTVGIEAKFKL